METEKRIQELEERNAALLLKSRNDKLAAIGRIARVIAHEVRNPLTNIDLAISQIKADAPPGNESINMLSDMIQRNSQRINQLIGELMEATRFAELNCTQTSIENLLEEVLVLANDSLETNQVQVVKNFNQQVGNIFIDPQKMKTALLNIINTIIESIEPGPGEIQVSIAPAADKCEIKITEVGTERTQEELNNIFEPYFSSKTNFKGLRLTNAANTILNHSGEITVYNEPGLGTTFLIKL